MQIAPLAAVRQTVQSVVRGRSEERAAAARRLQIESRVVGNVERDYRREKNMGPLRPLKEMMGAPGGTP